MRGLARFPAGVGVGALALSLVATLSAARAQVVEWDEEPGWYNDAELSLVVTEGNSSTETFGFKDKIVRAWERSRFRLRLEGVRSNTAGDRYAVVDPDDPAGFVITEPDQEPDVEKYLFGSRYDHRVNDRLYWNLGGSWDRDRDAGILNRYQAFAGAGHIWWSEDGREFTTGYALSYTDREEETPDPTKDDSFAGVRLEWSYMRKLTGSTKYLHDWTVNTNIGEPSDFASNMNHAVAVAINSKVSLKVSLQWLYNNQPALEALKLYERDATGNLVGIGTVNVAKKKSDLVFGTALVVSL